MSKALTRQEIFALLGRVPTYDAFLKVDDLLDQCQSLAAELPQRVSWSRIGTSRLGEPIHQLVVGDGSRHAVIFAGVHPNEPIGSLTALHLTRTLAEDEELAARLGYTWHIIACIDPDGMRLNEGWFQGPITRATYGRGFYRPAPDEQVEWTFPLVYKDVYFDRMLPETVALMRLLEETRPAFMCALHNGELGGVYYYLSEAAPELYPILAEIPQYYGLPLDIGEPEAPFITELAPAIYNEINMSDEYEFLVSIGMDPVAAIDAGDSSAAFAKRFGTFSLVSELPYWQHADASDPTLTQRSYRDVIRERGERLGELSDLLIELLARTDGQLAIDTPFARATRQFAPMLRHTSEQDLTRAQLPDSNRPATVAEVFTAGDLVHCFRLRYGGMLLRALQAEANAGCATPATRDALKQISNTYDGWCKEALAVTPAETIALQALVGVQFGAIIAGADHATRRASALPSAEAESSD